MSESTLKQLRARAKALGLKGYSKLAKSDLLRRLAAPLSSAPSTPKTTARKVPPRERRVNPTKAATEKRRTRAPAPATSAESIAAAEQAEQRIEETKYALRPQGAAPLPSPDLGEDIDRLPVLNEPAVCLLAQKPGVLYAYWRLSPEDAGANGDYRLRLYRLGNDATEVYDEVTVRADQGGWYFHVPASAAGHEVAIQLGYYRDGRFIGARGQSVARLPTLYASSRTDHRWWISAEDFARLYVRAGGVVTANRFGWSASISSASVPAPSSNEHMSWPGGVSSR